MIDGLRNLNQEYMYIESSMDGLVQGTAHAGDSIISVHHAPSSVSLQKYAQKYGFKSVKFLQCYSRLHM
jgi:hypothetical protein